MLKDLRKEALFGNRMLPSSGLVKLTFGNVSVIDRIKRVVAIKPSGVNFDNLNLNSIVLTDLDGNILEGDKKPSSDLPTHLELYKNFPKISSIIHTHSEYATSFAQARKPLDCFGTTHADHFHGTIPITEDLSREEIEKNYELNTGKAITRTFREKRLNYLEIPACLVASHGPFIWGEFVKETLENAIVLEEIAKMNYKILLINPTAEGISEYLLDKHFFRKHGKTAYYGQKK